jgi:ribosomal-protein-alanine N-acetyltransferase
LASCVRQGAKTATLEVRAGNDAAQQLYRAYGFVEVNRRPRYYADNNEDALIMTVFLDDRNDRRRVTGDKE